ncbi:MAG: hypothetical protein EXR53_05395 [Dehalococcoidia bacterium]|nr:hypothetical protein [Dehalococcoidia bacterium]
MAHTPGTALAIVSLAFAGAGLWLLDLTRAVPTPDRWGFKGFTAVFAVLSAVLGAAICSRHPRNPVGWLFNGMGLQSGIQVFVENYSVYSLLYKPGTPGGMAAGSRLDVVHGYGSTGVGGVLCTRLRGFLERHKSYLEFQPGENVDGNRGHTIVVSMKPLPSLGDQLEEEIWVYCA